MADVIVKQFVIDTSQSEQNLKAVEVQVKATTTAVDGGAAAINNVAKAEDNVATSSKSLKAQLRELQAQLANTAPDSAKYRELSAAAGELKDKIQDAAQAVGTQAGSAFEKVGGSLGLVTSRIANLDFEGAAEGAKLLAKNITDIKPGDIANGIKGIGSALGSIGKALLTNPIFLIGAAIAAAIVYSKELLSLIDGVTDAETEALNKQKERAALAKEQVDIIGQQEESLKRQGYSEKQIYDLKVKALDAAILEQQIVVETSKTQAKAQIAAAERNYNYLKGFLDFVTLPQRKLTEFFFNFYNGAVDLINKLGFSFEKVDVTAITKGFDTVNDTIAKALFDPEKTKAEGDKVIKESEATLRQLNNQRDGLINAQNAKEKAAAQKAADDKLKQEQALAAELEKQRQAEIAAVEAAEKAKAEASRKALEERRQAYANYYNALAALQDENYLAGLTAQEKEELAISQKYEKLIELAEKAGIDTTEITKQWQDELVNVTKNANAEVTADTKTSTEDQVKTRQESLQKGLQFAASAISVLQAFNDASTKKGEADAKRKFRTDKALAIAAAAVQTGQAVTGALTAGGNPIKLATGAQFVEAAFAAALGAAQIVKIKNTQYGGGGTDTTTSTTPPSVADTGNQTQPAQFNPLAAQFIQNRPDQVTPRAFVLAGDVASQQEVRQKVEDLARIG